MHLSDETSAIAPPGVTDTSMVTSNGEVSTVTPLTTDQVTMTTTTTVTMATAAPLPAVIVAEATVDVEETGNVDISIKGITLFLYLYRNMKKTHFSKLLYMFISVNCFICS